MSKCNTYGDGKYKIYVCESKPQQQEEDNYELDFSDLDKTNSEIISENKILAAEIGGKRRKTKRNKTKTKTKRRKTNNRRK
jgi:hypothetical protein